MRYELTDGHGGYAEAETLDEAVELAAGWYADDMPGGVDVAGIDEASIETVEDLREEIAQWQRRIAAAMGYEDQGGGVDSGGIVSALTQAEIAPIAVHDACEALAAEHAEIAGTADLAEWAARVYAADADGGGVLDETETIHDSLLRPWDAPDGWDAEDDNGEDFTVRDPAGFRARWDNSVRAWILLD